MSSVGFLPAFGMHAIGALFLVYTRLGGAHSLAPKHMLLNVCAQVRFEFVYTWEACAYCGCVRAPEHGMHSFEECTFFDAHFAALRGMLLSAGL